MEAVQPTPDGFRLRLSFPAPFLFSPCPHQFRGKPDAFFLEQQGGHAADRAAGTRAYAYIRILKIWGKWDVVESGFQENNEGNDVEGGGFFLGLAQSPTGNPGLPVDSVLDLVDNALDVQDGMAGKDVGKAVGEVADQTFARTPLQPEFEPKLVVVRGGVGEPDVVGALVHVSVQGFEKRIRPLGGKEAVHHIGGKKLVKSTRHSAFPSGARIGRLLEISRMSLSPPAPERQGIAFFPTLLDGNWGSRYSRVREETDSA
jgi:hypothetical protein